MSTSIVLIDEQKLFREGIKRILDFESSFEVVAEGDNGAVVLDLIEIHQPDIVLLDINMTNMNGLEVTANITARYPDIKIIIFSIHDDYLTHVLKIGAHGYLLKDMDSDSLLKAINIVNGGGTYLHPKVIHHFVTEYRRLSTNTNVNIRSLQMKEYRKPLHLLTSRECEVLQLLVNGNNNRGIAKSLDISDKTVKNYVSNILKKMNVNDRTQAVVTAIKNGWVKVV